jgi:hypothetical protein
MGGNIERCPENNSSPHKSRSLWTVLRAINPVVPAALLATAAALCGASPVAANPLCKPSLAVKEVAFSNPVNLRRYWSATLAVDASSCADQSGLFALGFLRLAENAPDLEFVEPFLWQAGVTKVRIELWAGESVQSYWIADVAACRCRPN